MKSVPSALCTLTVSLLLTVAGLAQESDSNPAPPPSAKASNAQKNRKIPCFLPGNRGLAAFCEVPPKVIGNTPYPGEMRCDGHVILLSDARYDYHVTDADADATSPPGYLMRLEMKLAAGNFNKILVDLRVTDELLSEIARAGTDARDKLCSDLQAVLSRSPAAAISFDTQPDHQDTMVLYDALRRMPSCPPIGCMLRDRSISSAAAIPWDFVILDASRVDEFRDASEKIHAIDNLATCPVNANVLQPDFDEEIRLLIQGVAGLYHADLPPEDSPDHDRAWRNLRGLSIFVHRLPGSQLSSMPEMVGPDTPMAFGTTGSIYCIRVRAAAAPTVTFPEETAKPEFVGIWYNDHTDENIILPRTIAPSGGTLRLQSPASPASWIYCYVPLPASTDSDTTTPAAVADPEISFEEIAEKSK